MAERDVEKARREAKLRTRSGQSKSYMRALNEIAAENGFGGKNGNGDWAEYLKALAAMAPQPQDVRVRLVAADASERTAGIALQQVWAYHDINEAQWSDATQHERLQLVFEYALSSRREHGDLERYTPELIESNVPTLTVPPGGQGTLAHFGCGSAEGVDFTVVLESRSTGKKEIVGVQLADLLEFHGLGQADWDASSYEEQEALVEESALWTKRGAGDMAGYFAEVVSGLDQGEGSAPR